MAHKRPDGRWRVRWREGSRRRSESFPTKVAAERFEAKLRLGEHRSVGLAEGADMTFDEFSAEWIERYCKLEKAESQWREDESVLRNHLSPAFGSLRLRDLRKANLQRLKEDLKRKPALPSGKARRPREKAVSAKTVNNVIGLAKKMLATAVEWEILGANPFAGVKPYPLTDQAFDYWTTEEVERFVRHARHHDPEFTTLVLVAARTGLRRGELAGLQRYQLDFDRRQIQVSAVFCYKSGSRHERTKNRSVGFVPMPKAVVEALRDRTLMAAEAFVFDREMVRHAVTRFRRLCKKVGARPIRFHDLRHTYASNLVAAGVPLFTVQKLMRHKSIQMTQRYAHLAPDYLREAVAVLDGAGDKSGPDLAPVSSVGSSM